MRRVVRLINWLEICWINSSSAEMTCDPVLLVCCGFQRLVYRSLSPVLPDCFQQPSAPDGCCPPKVRAAHLTTLLLAIGQQIGEMMVGFLTLGRRVGNGGNVVGLDTSLHISIARPLCLSLYRTKYIWRVYRYPRQSLNQCIFFSLSLSPSFTSPPSFSLFLVFHSLPLPNPTHPVIFHLFPCLLFNMHIPLLINLPEPILDNTKLRFL